MAACGGGEGGRREAGRGGRLLVIARSLASHSADPNLRPPPRRPPANLPDAKHAVSEGTEVTTYIYKITTYPNLPSAVIIVLSKDCKWCLLELTGYCVHLSSSFSHWICTPHANRLSKQQCLRFNLQTHPLGFM
ncbi:hypothetical protein SETIT_5G107100v2 [Setaria italica]|uniref:Uncharacterized protein n=2 Tax=Setaria TaxID=4554 RepID=A0A368R3E2_SETIT|nr:hypothetical protein SETIT_5G107100v2 [Setaria italica]TKW13487.1 hypothetical protein SEVIR_5G103900v2 [Setaria viridis]